VIHVERNIDEFVEQHPEYADVIKRCYEHQLEKQASWANDLQGFEWHMVQAEPVQLRKLYSLGILKIVYRSRSATEYRVADMDATKAFLEGAENPEFEAPATIEVPEAFLDMIIGFDDMKDQIARSLKAPKPVHFLFIGPPASAKTILLLELARLPGSYYVLGGSATKAGLYELLFSLRPAILLIDEIEKVDNIKTLSVLLSLMATGIVSETKLGKTRSTIMNTRVFACANRRSGLSDELVSRFAPFILRPYTPTEYQQIVRKVLVQREDKTEEIAGYIADKSMAELDTRDVRDAIRIARLTTTREDIDQTVAVMKKYKDAKTLVGR
jgi:Holliday junction DNA helicase RuvB